jgi:hypothetical protein
MSAKEEYDAEIAVLQEQKKMRMLTQDQFDKKCAEIADKYFPKPKKEEA